MSRMFGERCSSQASAACWGVAPSRAATSVQDASPCWGVNPREREVRDDRRRAGRRTGIEQRVVCLPVERGCTEVLDGRRPARRSGPRRAGPGVDGAEPQVPDQPLALQLGQNAERLGDRTGRRSLSGSPTRRLTTSMASSPKAQHRRDSARRRTPGTAPCARTGRGCGDTRPWRRYAGFPGRGERFPDQVVDDVRAGKPGGYRCGSGRSRRPWRGCGSRRRDRAATMPGRRSGSPAPATA